MAKVDSIVILNNQFRNFGKQMTRTPKDNPTYFLSKAKRFQKMYKQQDSMDIFCKESMTMAEAFHKANKLDYAGILYSWVIKLSRINPELREIAIKKAYNIAEIHLDIIHMLARIIDLKELYRGQNNKKYIEILIQEQKLLTDIVTNYKNASNRFSTVKNGIGPLDKYKYKLGSNCVDLAKKMLNSNPEHALKNLLQAKTIFTELKKDKELDFVLELISQVNKKI